MMYAFGFSKSGREVIRETRRLEKAQKARNRGDKTAMEKLWREDVARAEASGDPLERVSALRHLGLELVNQDRCGEADSLLRQAQEIARDAEGPAGFWSLGVSHDLGWMCEKQGRAGDAEAHFLEARHSAEKELGPEHHHVAFELLGLANFYHQHERRAEEIAAVERIIAIDERQKNDPQSEDSSRSMMLDRLAALYAAEGRDAEAEALYRRVIDQFTEMRAHLPKRMGAAILAGAYHRYGKLLRKRGENQAAAQYENYVEKLMKKIDAKGMTPRDLLDKGR